jgi:hypothetical protein
LHTMTVMEGPVESFDPESAETQFKPERSPNLETAEKSRTAERFLQTAQFPKASVETGSSASVVILRDLSAAATDQTTHEVAAVIELDGANRIISQKIIWAKQLSSPQ